MPDSQWQTLRASFQSQRNYGRFRPEASFPFDYTHPVGNDIPRSFSFVPEREWVFIVGLKVYGQGYTFDLGKVTLVGDRSQRVITDFATQAWVGLSSVENGPDGQDFGRFHVTTPVSDNPAKESSDWASTLYIGVKFSDCLSIANDGFHSFEMDYRLSGQMPEESIHLLCIGEEGGYPRKWMFNELPHYPVRVKSFGDTADFTRGVFEYTEKSLSGRIIQRTRDVFLTKGKKHDFLLVSDSVFVEDLDVYTAAPLWHVMDPVDLGEGWFEIAYQGRALIWLMPKLGSQIQVKSWDGLDPFQRDPYNSHVIYRGKTCEGGELEQFETLIIPLKPGENAVELRDSVSLVTESHRVLTIGSEHQILW